MWQLKYDTNEPVKKKQTHGRSTDLWFPRKRVLREGWSGTLDSADVSFYIESG